MQVDWHSSKQVLEELDDPSTYDMSQEELEDYIDDELLGDEPDEPFWEYCPECADEFDVDTTGKYAVPDITYDVAIQSVEDGDETVGVVKVSCDEHGTQFYWRERWEDDEEAEYPDI